MSDQTRVDFLSDMALSWLHNINLLFIVPSVKTGNNWVYCLTCTVVWPQLSSSSSSSLLIFHDPLLNSLWSRLQAWYYWPSGTLVSVLFFVNVLCTYCIYQNVSLIPFGYKCFLFIAVNLPDSFTPVNQTFFFRFQSNTDYTSFCLRIISSLQHNGPS